MMKRNIEDYFKIYNDVLTKENCEQIVSELEKHEWIKHSYYDSSKKESRSYENELSISYSSSETNNFLMEKLWHTIDSYVRELNFEWYNGWNGYSSVRYNKYDIDSEMRLHCDHIHSMFDGERKGIPTLTLLGGLNEDYEGGELVMWGDKEVVIPPGSIAVFPSNFLYPHKVNPVISGVRYSYVSWVW